MEGKTFHVHILEDNLVKIYYLKQSIVHPYQNLNNIFAKVKKKSIFKFI